MDEWHSAIHLGAPCWRDYREPLEQLKAEGFPATDRLTRLLPDGAHNQQGHPIQFVPSTQIPGANYEVHIFDTGQVSTREKCWHDLFNALVWSRFPGLKAAINASHVRAMKSDNEPGRGKQRDALTLFDECGVIVAASDAEPLGWLAKRDWRRVFTPGVAKRYRLFIFGHAMLEKCLDPYKSMTANALLVRLSEHQFALPRRELRNYLDIALAGLLDSSEVLVTSKGLAPLPLMGLPGWWMDGAQDKSFYNDEQVFRPAPPDLKPAPVFSLSGHQI